MEMENELTIGIKILNGFLRIMVAVLIVILVAVIFCLILAAFGFF
tara:strand:+ start:2074 stop:2208 length:135 start_codon:yes stop_codon:yes gene_type:complete